MFIYFIKLKQKVIITNFTFLSRRNVGLKLEYQLWEDYITAKSEYSEKLNNNEDDELPAKKLKLNDNKRITNLEYSVKLPVAPFIDYLEKYSNTFVIHILSCLQCLSPQCQFSLSGAALGYLSLWTKRPRQKYKRAAAHLHGNPKLMPN